MEFELPTKETEAKVLSVDEHSIMLIKENVIKVINRINSFIDDFNEAHNGMAIQFNRRYTEALLNDKLRDEAGVDFYSFIEKSPKFLQAGLNQQYKDFISAIYDKSSHVSDDYGRVFHAFSEATNGGNLTLLLKIADDGKFLLTEELDQVLRERFTVFSNDINPELVEKIEQYILLENEIKALVGKFNFKNVMTTQCPIEFNEEFHLFDANKLTSYIKKHQIDTYTIKED